MISDGRFEHRIHIVFDSFCEKVGAQNATHCLPFFCDSSDEVDAKTYGIGVDQDANRSGILAILSALNRRILPVMSQHVCRVVAQQLFL
jgi:hypothetical protein